MRFFTKLFSSSVFLFTVNTAFGLDRLDILKCAKNDIIKVQAATNAQTLDTLNSSLVSNALSIDSLLKKNRKDIESYEKLTIESNLGLIKAKNEPIRTFDDDAAKLEVRKFIESRKIKDPDISEKRLRIEVVRFETEQGFHISDDNKTTRNQIKVLEIALDRLNELLTNAKQSDANLRKVDADIAKAKSCTEVGTIIKSATFRNDTLYLSESEFNQRKTKFAEIATDLGLKKVSETLSYKHHSVHELLFNANDYAKEKRRMPTFDEMQISENLKNANADELESKLFMDKKAAMLKQLENLLK